MINMLGRFKVKKIILEAVKAETNESLEFLKVSHPVNYLVIVLIMITSIKRPLYIRESVDSLCRDGADAQYMGVKQKPYNFPTNTQKAYIASSLPF